VVQTSDRLRERLATLRSVSRALARPLDVTSVLRAVHLELSRVLDVTICFYGVYDAPGQSVDVIWQMHDNMELPGGSFPLGSGPTSRAIRECRVQLIREWSREGPPVQLQYATDRAGLPESSIVAPVVFDGAVIGILAVQSYRARAYDEDDVALVQGVADQVAVAVSSAVRTDNNHHHQANGSEVEAAVLASMPDALLVLDVEGRLVRVNQAARRLLSSVILGQPVDSPQADHWPLGTRALTEALLPIVNQLKRGKAPQSEIQVSANNGSPHKLSCKASLLMREGAPAGGLMVLRELST